MFYQDWIKYPDSVPGEELYMRSTPVRHGHVIQHPDDGPGYEGEPKFSDRRYSVAEFDGTGYHLSIGSVAYHSGYDSTDPLEPFRKFLIGEWDTGITGYTDSMTSVTEWDGTVDKLLSDYRN